MPLAQRAGHSFCFKECAQELSISLSILFNKSLESSVLPDHWKEALVTPVFKKGDRTQVNNYRPISLTSPIYKIMESITRPGQVDSQFIIPACDFRNRAIFS